MFKQHLLSAQYIGRRGINWCHLQFAWTKSRLASSPWPFQSKIYSASPCHIDDEEKQDGGVCIRKENVTPWRYVKRARDCYMIYIR